VILAAREGAAPQGKGKIKEQIPAMAACFQAMRDWPSVEPHEIGCPALLLAGTKNKSTLEWVVANRDALDAAGVQTEVVEGLTHDQEFTKIDRVFPVVSAFFKNREG
jgi:pimeloyl-ACP methyl ester carboxylesterase